MMPRLVLALVVPNRTTTLHLHACSQNRRTRSRESTMCCYGNLFIVIVMNSLYAIQDKERKNVCGTTRTDSGRGALRSTVTGTGLER